MEMGMKKLWYCLISLALSVSLVSCASSGEHVEESTHRWGKFDYDNAAHWRNCLDEGCSAVDRQLHGTKTPVCMEIPICDICGHRYGDPVPHLYGDDGLCVRCSESEHSEGLEYFHGEGYYAVSGIGDCEWCDIEISSVHNGLPVVEIASHAFMGAHNVESILIPDSIMDIGWGAFSGCDHLTDVRLSSSLKQIEGYLFNGCVLLETVSVPEGVTKVGDRAFHSCDSLKCVDLPSTLTCIDGTPFDGCSSLSDIFFEGTAAQWDAVEKNLNAVPQGVTVHCTDQNIRIG